MASFIFPLHFAFTSFFQNNVTVICSACPLLNIHSPQNDFTMEQLTRNDKKPFQITDLVVILPPILQGIYAYPAL